MVELSTLTFIQDQKDTTITKLLVSFSRKVVNRRRLLLHRKEQERCLLSPLDYTELRGSHLEITVPVGKRKPLYLRNNERKVNANKRYTTCVAQKVTVCSSIY